MQWLSLMLSSVSLVVAIGAAIVARSYRRDMQGISARLASISGEVSRLATTEHSTVSTLAELAEVRDAIDKGNELLKRVNQREVMRARRNGALDFGATKDDLRRAAGLVAGKPAPHR